MLLLKGGMENVWATTGPEKRRGIIFQQSLLGGQLVMEGFF